MKLSDVIERYVTFKQSLGLRYRSEAQVLHAFCRAMGDPDLVEVSPSQVLIYLAGKGPITSAWHTKFRVLQGLYRFAIGRGYVEGSPLPIVLPKCPPAQSPYIYTTEELRGLLAATASLATPLSPLQATTFRILLLVLMGTGVRISEALALTLADVQLEDSVLLVRHTKFGKTRLVPTGPHLTAQLDAYAQQRRHLPHPAGDASAFFATRAGKPIRYGRVYRLFCQLRARAGIVRHDGVRSQPRLHDLRHTAAVTRVVTWYREGADIQRLLPQLATYLGHGDLRGTQGYLTMTADLLQEASSRFEHYAFSEVSHGTDASPRPVDSSVSGGASCPRTESGPEHPGQLPGYLALAPAVCQPGTQTPA
jgi:integrase/recombinase XerD